MNNKMNQEDKSIKVIVIACCAIAIMTLVINMVMNGIQSMNTWMNVCKALVLVTGLGCATYGFMNRVRIKLGYLIMFLGCVVSVLGAVTIAPIL